MKLTRTQLKDSQLNVAPLSPQARALAERATLARSPRGYTVAIFDTSESLAEFGGHLLLSRAQAQPSSRFNVALSGGQTPDTMFMWLAKQILPANIHFFFVDERYVSIDSADSNFKKAKTLLFSRAGVKSDRVHRYQTELPAEEAAASYETLLRNSFHMPTGVPSFDLIYLGMGDDGHTASLFPQSSALHEQRRLALVATNTHTSQTRLTLSLPVLNAARESVVMIQGDKKANMVAQVLSESARQHPIEYVEPISGRMIFALEAAAARDLQIQ